jgi:cation transport regulator ChaC
MKGCEMSPEKYIGYEKVINDALVAARGGKSNAKEDKIAALEKKLETMKLSNAEVADIQKQLKQLKSI